MSDTPTNSASPVYDTQYRRELSWVREQLSQYLRAQIAPDTNGDRTISLRELQNYLIADAARRRRLEGAINEDGRSPENKEAGFITQLRGQAGLYEISDPETSPSQHMPLDLTSVRPLDAETARRVAREWAETTGLPGEGTIERLTGMAATVLTNGSLSHLQRRQPIRIEGSPEQISEMLRLYDVTVANIDLPRVMPLSVVPPFDPLPERKGRMEQLDRDLTPAPEGSGNTSIPNPGLNLPLNLDHPMIIPRRSSPAERT